MFAEHFTAQSYHPFPSPILLQIYDFFSFNFFSLHLARALTYVSVKNAKKCTQKKSKKGPKLYKIWDFIVFVLLSAHIKRFSGSRKKYFSLFISYVPETFVCKVLAMTFGFGNRSLDLYIWVNIPCQ